MFAKTGEERVINRVRLERQLFRVREGRLLRVGERAVLEIGQRLQLFLPRSVPRSLRGV